MEATMDNAHERRLSAVFSVFLLLSAGMFDLGSLVPLLNFVIVPVGIVYFWTLFKLSDVDVGFTRPERALTLGGTSVIEAVPALSTLPAWIVGVGGIILLVQLEDSKLFQKTIGKIAEIPGAGEAAQQGLKALSKSRSAPKSVRKLARRVADSPEVRNKKLERMRNIQGIRAKRQKEASAQQT